MLPRSHPCIHAAARMLQHSRRCILSPLSRRSIDAVALTLQQLCHRSDAAEFKRTSHAAAFFGCSISSRNYDANLTLPHPSVAFTLQLAHRSIYAAALALVLCTWTRTRQSAFSNAEHDAGGREPGRVARGGAGPGGGRFLKRGVLGWDGGRFMYVHIPERGV